jgi:DNA-binding response OmpR family regulator
MGKNKGLILCVEQNRGISLLIATALGALDYEVVRAFAYADGVTQSQARAFDLCIVNSELSDGSGIELCKLIREKDPKAVIILTSGGDKAEEFIDAKAAGVNCILIKPYEIDTISRMVTMLLFCRALMS